MAVVYFGKDELTGERFTELNKDQSKVAPNPSDFDTTDFPCKGCRICGKRDRPQYKGQCNDGNCDTLLD